LAAAQRLIPFSLELGGKNPMVFMEGAPLNEAAKSLVVGAFSNSGQTCVAVERVYVEESIFDEFARRVSDGASKLKIGWSRSWDLDMGSLISSDHAGKVMNHVTDAVHRGARVLAGGRRRDDIGPNFVEPTVLANVSPDALLASEETFGPVVALYPVRSADEAVSRANSTSYGLNATVWASDTGSAQQIARSIEAGSVAINSTLMIFNSFDAPMGGMKLSGLGRRHGEQGILRFTQAQSIVTSFAWDGGYDAILARMTDQKKVNRLLSVLRWWQRL
jgi:acyl-CoA reductase-like NAD-dependent aldehyde dehydrogenase